MKSALKALSGVLLLGLLLSCSSPAPAPPTQEPAPVGQTSAPATVAPAPTAEPTKKAEGPVILRVGGVQGIDCWNPYSCSDHWDYNDLVYEGFNSHGERCKAEPRLADSMEVTPDGLTWTLHLHPGVTFSNGEPFNARVAAEFIKWFNTTEIRNWFYTTVHMQSVEALDDNTLQFKLDVPVSNFPNYDAVWFWMAPPSIWGHLDDKTLLTYDNSKPIGTGPYVVSDWKPGEYIVFDARPDYYRGKLPVDKIIYTQYKNWDAVIQAFLAGEIDLTVAKMPPQYYDTLKNAPHTTVEERAPGEMHLLAFNLYPKGKKNPAVENQAVREAIDYAIDKQQLVDVTLLGHGLACPNNWACGPNYEGELNPDLKLTPFDPEKARQILEDAGFKDTNGDGVRESADGKPLELRLFYPVEVPAELTMAESMKRWLGDVGIAVNAEAQETGTLYNMVMTQRDYDMAIMYESADLDPAYLDFTVSGWSAEAGSSADNISGWSDKKIDDLIYQYMTTPDRQEAMKKIFEAQAIVNQARPYIVLGAENQIQAFNSDKFDFPRNTCDIGLGMWGFPGVMQIVVK